MIKLKDRIRAFATVGQIMKNMQQEEKTNLYQRAKGENSWFTDESITLALDGLQAYLDENKLTQWTKHLPQQPQKIKKVGVMMAGNIPLVGFHDFLTVLISGHQLLAKLSSQDGSLMKYVAGILTEIEPWFKEQIHFVERLNEADAIIATGSDNSARYFEYYFARMPHIIRHNRTSVAVLDGQETEDDFEALGKDVFQYFGLGCRNVAKLYVPENFDFKALLDAWQSFQTVLYHHKYSNNYDYNKSIYLVNRDSHYDTGFMLLKPSEQLVSPISVVFYEVYKNRSELEGKLAQHQDKIQCIVSREAWVEGSLPLGNAQQPELGDYADGVDTLEFVRQL